MFANSAQFHYDTTGPEIINDLDGVDELPAEPATRGQQGPDRSNDVSAPLLARDLRPSAGMKDSNMELTELVLSFMNDLSPRPDGLPMRHKGRISPDRLGKVKLSTSN